MSKRPTEFIRNEHKELATHLGHLRALADRLRGNGENVDSSELQHVFDWLVSELLPHAAAEEAHLYPLVDRIMDAGIGSPSATMSVDHQVIRQKIQEFGEATSALNGGAKGRQARGLRDKARILAYQIDALLSLHFRKEEEIYLHLIDQHASPEDVEQMHAAAHGGVAAHAHRH